MPAVSILMSSYNGGKYLRIALDSILAQTFSDFEIIIVNDASTDETAQILSDYVTKDPRVHTYTNDKNQGLTAGLNIALHHSDPSSTWICRMDDDDICAPQRLEMQVRWMEEHPETDVLGTCAQIIDDAGQITGTRRVPETHEAILATLPKYNPLIHPSILLRRGILENVGGYNEAFRTSQDYELWFRLAASGAHFANLPENLLFYRENRSTIRRKSMKYRLRDFQIRRLGYQMLHLPIYKYVWLLLPLILGLVPMPVYCLLKKLDPRRNKKIIAL